MKQILHSVLLFATFSFLTSCATLIGGSKYKAHVLVYGHPNANIKYKGISQGNGSAEILVPRRDASKFEITVNEYDCDEATYKFVRSSGRGWAFLGSLFTPGGIIIDGITGACFKPNVKEKGVSKIDFVNFSYRIEDYECRTNINHEKGAIAAFEDAEFYNRKNSIMVYTGKNKEKNLDLIINGKIISKLIPNSYCLLLVTGSEENVNICIKSDSEEYCESFEPDEKKTLYFEAIINKKGKLDIFPTRSEQTISWIWQQINDNKLSKISPNLK